MSYTKKTFEELDLIDNFLTNAVAAAEGIGERCYRRIISVLLEKEVGKVRIHSQKIVPALTPQVRGIRMDVEVQEWAAQGGEKEVTDVYDVEPHQRDKLDLPRHNRFYQAKMDSRFLRSGERNFSKLPNLYVIMITNYDPFGHDYMKYTFRNACEEVPGIEYNDGLQFVYFNTKGSKGGSRKIRNMLSYIQSSRETNAVDEATREVHDCVKRVKESSKMRGDYMTLGEYWDDLLEDAVQEVVGEAVQKAVQEAVQKAVADTVFEERANVILESLEEHGEVPRELKEKITAARDMELLRRWNKLAVKAESIDEFVSAIGEQKA